MGIRDLCLGSINHGIFAKETTPSTYTKYFAYIFCHLKVYVTDRSLCKDEYILPHLVGEEYFAFLPEQMKIEEESAAKTYFANVVRSALKSVKHSNPDYTVCFPQGLSYESYETNQEFDIGYKEGSGVKKYPDPFKNPADFRAKVSSTLEFNNKKVDIGALFEVAYDLVLMLALMMFPVRLNLPKEVGFLTFVTFAKKGLVREEYIGKVETVIQEELQLTIKLNETQIKKLWRNYEPQMSAELMAYCVKSTLAELPEESVRLRKLVELCKWHGLTCYLAVKQALENLPNFPWNRLTNLSEYKTEMDAYKEAAQLVGDNAFFGYNPSIGKAKSMHYKNLASVCAKILVDTKRSPALDNAACFTKSYASKDIVDGVVAEYIREEKLTGKTPVKSTGTLPGSSEGKTWKTESQLRKHPKSEDTRHASTAAELSGSGKNMSDSPKKPPLRKPKPLPRRIPSDDELSLPDRFEFDFYDDDTPSWQDTLELCDSCDIDDGIYCGSRSDCFELDLDSYYDDFSDSSI